MPYSYSMHASSYAWGLSLSTMGLDSTLTRVQALDIKSTLQ